MTVQGIDVSNFQGVGFPWQDWKGRLQFAMAKATEGDGFTDPDFARNWAGMLELNRTMPRFAYSFFHPAQDPVVQAAHLVATVRGHGLLEGDNFVCDLEDNDGLPPTEVAFRAAAFLHHVNEFAPGHRVILYTYPGFANAGNCYGLGAWRLWIANYQVERPTVPAPWNTWTFWQTGDQPLDTDVFNGTEAELAAFCRMPASR